MHTNVSVDFTASFFKVALKDSWHHILDIYLRKQLTAIIISYLLQSFGAHHNTLQFDYMFLIIFGAFAKRD